jgi:hypothetical protein
MSVTCSHGSAKSVVVGSLTGIADDLAPFSKSWARDTECDVVVAAAAASVIAQGREVFLHHKNSQGFGMIASDGEGLARI